MDVVLDVGSWGLFCGQAGRQLVLVDDQPTGPVSARRITQPIPRRLLLHEDRVARVFQSAQPTSGIPDEVVAYNGIEWTIAMRPVLSPRSSTLVGLLAAVAPSPDPLPAPPLIGGWEWEIERGPNGQPTPHRRTYWDRALFSIYDVNPDVAQFKDGYWEAGDWANELIDQTDQMRVSASIREGIGDGMSGVRGILRRLTYNVVTGYGYGPERRGRRHLRLVGQVPNVQPADKLILQGFSHEAPPDFHDLAFEHDAARVDDVLRGVLELADEPMAVIDSDTLDILMTSPAWRRQEFGHVGGLGDIADDDPAVLRRFIATSIENDSNDGQHPSGDIRLRKSDGSVQGVRITVTSVRSTNEEHGRDALIKLDLGTTLPG